MTTEPNTIAPHPERTETDVSLRAERERTDEELGRLATARDKDADEVVELARVRADELLATAEKKEDANGHGVDIKADLLDRMSARASAQDLVNE
jgi:hypothetical protein